MNINDFTPNQRKLFDEIISACTSGAYVITMLNTLGDIDIYFNASKWAGIRFKNVICNNKEDVVFNNYEAIKEELEKEIADNLADWIAQGGTEEDFAFISEKEHSLNNILQLYEDYKNINFKE